MHSVYFSVKVLLNWLQCNSSVMSNNLFRSKLHVSTLCKFFNQLKSLHATSEVTVDNLDNTILPEEKKLLGFLPLTRCYENLQYCQLNNLITVLVLSFTFNFCLCFMYFQRFNRRR